MFHEVHEVNEFVFFLGCDEEFEDVFLNVDGAIEGKIVMAAKYGRDVPPEPLGNFSLIIDRIRHNQSTFEKKIIYEYSITKMRIKIK